MHKKQFSESAGRKWKSSAGGGKLGKTKSSGNSIVSEDQRHHPGSKMVAEWVLSRHSRKQILASGVALMVVTYPPPPPPKKKTKKKQQQQQNSIFLLFFKFTYHHIEKLMLYLMHLIIL